MQLLISSVYKYYSVIEKPEITLEANPDDLDEQKIIELSKTKINRLSIGIQSFFEDDLLSMNRAHSSIEAKECLTTATKYFDNITIDLIYGIPDMSVSKWNKNLQIAFDFRVNHISSYALTVEPKTALDNFIKKGTYPPIDETLALKHFNHLIAETEAKGFIHYEISNFGKADYFSKHNTSYWQGKSYLGIGPSAHSFNGRERSWNVSNNVKYIKGIESSILPSKLEELSRKDRFNEYIMTGLRTIWGVSLKTIETEFGLEFKQHLLKAAQKYIDNGLLVIVNRVKQSTTTDEITPLLTSRNDDLIKTTKKGKFLVDGITSDLFMI